MVDNFLPGQSIPHCQIFAALIDPGKARGRHLCHQVNLRGAKAPSNYINIHLSIKGIIIILGERTMNSLYLDYFCQYYNYYTDTNTSLIGSSSALGKDDILHY